MKLLIMDKLIQYSWELGLDGRELHQFIQMQQNMERDEGAENRRLELAKLELKVKKNWSRIRKGEKGDYRKRTVKHANCFGIEK